LRLLLQHRLPDRCLQSSPSLRRQGRQTVPELLWELRAQ
jgi:hypothetical protein